MSINSKMTAIADAIRDKTGKTEEMTLDQMATEIAGIETGGGLDEQWIRLLEKGGSYSDLCTFVIPDDVTKIGISAFSEWYFVEHFVFPKTIKSIDKQAFYYNGSLTEAELPECLTSIGKKAFYGCSKMTQVTFRSTPTIQADSFGACSNLTTINVPWAEGDVANAPWGANSATINYNYTEG